jgi:hypothetical protein
MSFHCPNGCPAGEECYYIPHVHIAACVHCGGPDEYCCGGSNGPRCTYGVCQFVGGNGLPRCLPPGSGLPPL